MLSVKVGVENSYKVGAKEAQENERTISSHLATLFISALAGNVNDSAACNNLLSYLAQLSPDEIFEVTDNPQIQHYLHRLVQHVIKYTGSDDVLAKLAHYFPNTVENFQENKLPISYSYSDLKPSTSQNVEVFDHEISTSKQLFKYNPRTIAATFKAQPIRLPDISKAVTTISMELKELEKSRASSNISPTKRALTIDRNTCSRQSSRASQRLKFSEKAKFSSEPEVKIPTLVPISLSEANDPHLQVSKSGHSLFPCKKTEPMSRLKGSLIKSSEPSLKSAYDVIDAFVSGQELESIYLNYVYPNKWHPYELTVTLKTKVFPEYFIMSKFGILHIYPDGTSDFQHFAEWLREASMYTLLRQIEFFRDYKIRRAFQRWHQTVKFAKFYRLYLKIDKIGIRYFPIFSDALLKLKHLSEELLTIPFHNLVPLGGYTVGEFEHNVKGFQSRAKQFLQKYFKHCRRIVCDAIHSVTSHAHKIEMEHHNQRFVPDIPLSIQQTQQKELERDLKVAIYQKEKLGDFINLAEQLVSTCLLSLSHQSADSWRDTVLSASSIPHQLSCGFQLQAPQKGLQNHKKYFLLSSLGFNQLGKVTTDPNSAKIKDLLCGFLNDILEIVISAVHQLDAPEQRLSRPDTNKSILVPTIIVDSPSECLSVKPARSPLVHQEPQKLHREFPSSLAPCKQPKSIAKALKGTLHDIKKLEQSKHSEMLASQMARRQLSLVEPQEAAEKDMEIKKREHSILNRKNFSEKLSNDGYFQSVCMKTKEDVERVCDQLESLCEEYNWMSDVWEFIRSWEGSRKEYDMEANEFEVTLNRLYKWQNKLHALPSELLTPYSMLCISSSTFVGSLLSTLAGIQSQIKFTAIQRAQLLCARILDEAKQNIEALSSRRYDLEGYAEYARHLRECHNFQSKELPNISFVVKVYSILQCQGIEVPQRDKESGKLLLEVWKRFELILLDADEFVAKQTPIKAQGLHDSIKSCEEELQALVNKVNQGVFIDSDRVFPELSKSLEIIQEDASAVHSRLLGLSKWKEAVNGLPHDLTNVNNLLDKIFVRQELWKYRGVFDNYEKEWMTTPFKKLNIDSISAKISDWFDVCTKLEKTLPKDDPVLNGWRERLGMFKKEIPLLTQLSSDVLKTSHWVTIFATLGEEYDPKRQYTLNDFSLYNIYEHSKIIFKICHDAMQEEKLKTKVSEMQLKLESSMVDIIQVPIDRYPFALPNSSPDLAPAPLNVKKTLDKVTSFAFNFHKTTDEPIEHLYSMGNVSEISIQLENDIVQLKMYLTSPHMGGFRHQGNYLLDSLSHLEELILLLTECQEQLQHMLLLFKSVDSSLYENLGLVNLQTAVSKFQEITEGMRDDRRLSSLIQKRRGQKGFREIQGEALRQTCDTILVDLGKVKEKVRNLLEKGIETFPRLCFLSDRDLLTVMCNIGELVPIIPIINKIFPAIQDIRFTGLTPSKNNISTADSGEGYQILSIKGWQGEQLSLSVPLPLMKKPTTEWLNALEYAISYSLGSALNETYMSLPDLLKGSKTLTDEIVVEFFSWLAGHMEQCVLLSMELHWTLVLHSALTSDEPDQQLKLTSTKITTAMESVAGALLKWDTQRPPSTNLLLQHLILSLRRKFEITSSIIVEEIFTPESFLWRTQLHYSTEVENLYALHDENICLKSKLSSNLGQESNSSISVSRQSIESITRSQPFPVTIQTHQTSSVTSSKSLLSFKDGLIANAAGKASTTDLHSRTGSSIVSKIAGSYPPLRCFVHCFDSVLPYGFEFLGSDAHILLTPQTERSLLSLINAMNTYKFPTVSSSSCSSSRSTIGREFAIALGRHFYVVDCSLLSEVTALKHLLFGAAHTGSQLQLDNFHSLPQLLMISLGQWLRTLSKALSEISLIVVPKIHCTATRSSEITRPSSILLTPGTEPSSQSQLMLGKTLLAAKKHVPPSPSPLNIISSVNASRSSSQHRSLQQSFATESKNRTSRNLTRMDWYQQLEEAKPTDLALYQWLGYGGGTRRRVEIDDAIFMFSPSFGCVLAGNTTIAVLPEQLKSILRPIDVMQPKMAYLSEALLASNGFYEAQTLGAIVADFLQQLKHQLSSSNPGISSSIGIPTLRRIISHAAQLLVSEFSSSTPIDESKAVAMSIIYFFSPQLTISRIDEDTDTELRGGTAHTDLVGWNKLRELLRTFFPSYIMDSSHLGERICLVPEELLDAIRTQLQERHLQLLPSLIEKIQQLHLRLQQSNCVFLSGPSGSGKTTCLNILAAAYQHVRELHVLSGQSGSKMSIQRQQEKSKDCNYPSVNMITINPGVYSMDELFGFFKEEIHSGESSHSMWQEGILTKIIQGITYNEEVKMVFMHPDIYATYQTTIVPITHWLVLDGPLSPNLEEALHHLSTDGITLKNGEKLSLPRSCQLIIESPTLSFVTPSFLSSSYLVHCSKETISSNDIVNRWLEKAPTQHNLSTISVQNLAVMIRQLLPETLKYLTDVNTKHNGGEYATWSESQVYGITETQCFLNLLSAVLERNAPKMESSGSHSTSFSQTSRLSSRMCDQRASSAMYSFSGVSLHTEASSATTFSKLNIPETVDNASEVSSLEAEFALSLQVQLAAMISFAYIWSLGSFVPFSESKSFSDLARDLIVQLPYAVPLPEDGSVFDYFLDLKLYQFIPWAERKSGTRRSSGGYVTLPELERFLYISDLYLSYGYDVILTGLRGTGKTSFVSNLLGNYFSITRLPISHMRTAKQLQSRILEIVTQQEKKSVRRFSGGHKKYVQKTAFYLDDIHLAQSFCTDSCDDKSSKTLTNPSLELIRFMLCHHKLITVTRTYKHYLNCKFVASSIPEDYWRLPVRLTRNMCRVPFLPPSDECLHQVFSSNILFWLQAFPSETLGNADQIAHALSAASVTVHLSVCDKFKYSSSHPHYLITMHELLNVFEGMFLLSPSTKAQTQPQFGFLNRRIFLSTTTQSEKKPQKKLSSKLKSGKKGLPSLANNRKGALKKRVVASNDFDKADIVSTLRMLIRLWAHETTRVYLDRSSESKDHVWFLKLLETCIKYCFSGFSFDVSVEGGQGGQGGGHTANLGGRRIRGGRARGNFPQASLSADGLNAEELTKNGVKVDILKKLMLNRQEEVDDGQIKSDNPPKLISLDQVTVRGEDLTSLIFAQFPSHHNEPGSQISSSGYTELGDGQVMEVLSKHLEQFQSSCNHDIETDSPGQQSGSKIILYREAIEHCTRLYRVMNLPGAHALLLGTKGSGRKTLLKLMAYIKKSKVVDLDLITDHQMNLKQQLREVCISAALDNCHTILVLSNHSQLSFLEWDNVVNIMNEGLFSNLFTSSELLVMSGKLEAGKMKRTAQMAYQAFSRAVSAHLHVIVLWNLDSATGSLFCPETTCVEDALEFEESSRRLFQSLCQSCSYIDRYQPWTKHAFSDIAMQWWKQDSIEWENWADTSSQLEAISSLAAHAHITTIELMKPIYGELARHLVSPKVFMECLMMTQKIAIQIKQREMIILTRVQSAMKKLEDANQTVMELEQQLSTLKSQHEAAEKEVKQKMNKITDAKDRYMEASNQCKKTNEIIQFEMKNVQLLNKKVEEEYNKIGPIYLSALNGLSSVKQNDIYEIVSYREPPAILSPLFNAFCMLFDREENWESCQLLMMAHKFLEDLIFFDRDNVSQYKLQKLEEIIDRNTNFESIEVGSKAAVSLSTWLIALIDYNRAVKSMEPVKKSLEEAEKSLMNANKTFVDMQKYMTETKAALEDTVKEHRESVKIARRIENDIKDLNFKIKEAEVILHAMSTYKKQWDGELKAAYSRIDSVPGHAMLCAAGTCYLARTPPDKHKELLLNWLGYCSGTVTLGSLAVEHAKLQPSQDSRTVASHHQVVQVEKDFSLSDYLSDKAEQTKWLLEGTFQDGTIMDRCLSSRAVCTFSSALWPIVFDPFNQFEAYLRALEKSKEEKPAVTSIADPEVSVESNHPVTLKSSNSSLVSELKMGVIQGRTVFLSVDDCSLTKEYSDEDKTVLYRVLQRDFKLTGKEDEFSLTLSDGSSIPVNLNFKLYIIVHKPIKHILGSNGPVCLSSFYDFLGLRHTNLDVSVIDVELKKETLESYLQRFVMTHEKPEYQIRYKALLTDKSLHEQALENSQNMVLNSVIDLQNKSLLSANNLLGIIKESKESKLMALENICETKRSIEVLDKQAAAYRQLSHYACVVLNSVQRLSLVIRYFNFSIEKLEGILSTLMFKFQENKIADHATCTNARVLHLKHQLLLNVYSHLQMHVFERHQLLIPLLVGLEMQLHKEYMTKKELELLGRNLDGIGTQLDLIETNESKDHHVVKKPQWITDKSWCRGMQLKKEIPALRRLDIEISGSSSEWKEYFEMRTSIMTAVPGFGMNCSLAQKLLLWKAFKPEKFYTVAKEFILITIGASFIQTEPPSVDEIFIHTESQALTILLQPDYPNSSPSIADISTVAQSYKIEIKHFSLIGKESCDELFANLLSLSSEYCWAIVEHCHLLPNCQEILSRITEVLKSVETCSNFRIWVLMPLEYSLRHSISDCRTIIFQNPKISDVNEQSMQLLQDLTLLLSSRVTSLTRASKHAEGSWSDFGPIISKLKAFIPRALTESQLTALSPQPDSLQVLSSLVYEELCLHNQSVVSLQASLESLLRFLKGEIQFSVTIGKNLLSLSDDVIPPLWHEILPNPLCHMTSVMSAIKLLRSRMTFYGRVLQSKNFPSKLDPLLFSNCQDIISRKTSNFASEYQLNILSVVMEAKLFVDSGFLSGEAVQHNIVFSGLTLHGATWNNIHCHLDSQGDMEDKNTYCAVISFKSTNNAAKIPNSECVTQRADSDEVYMCPVFMNSRDAMITKLFHIQLPTSIKLAGTSAYLSCNSELHGTCT